MMPSRTPVLSVAKQHVGGAVSAVSSYPLFLQWHHALSCALHGSGWNYTMDGTTMDGDMLCRNTRCRRVCCAAVHVV